MTEHMIASRKSSKPKLIYFKTIYSAYLRGLISKEDYLMMTAQARVALLGQDPDEVAEKVSKLMAADIISDDAYSWE